MKNWRFALGNYEGAEAPDFDDSAWRILDLPHDWQIENNRDPDMEGGSFQGFYPRSQVGWYRYRFNAPAEWQDTWVRIRFDGVQRFSTVWLNGTKLGGHPYGYVPFDLDLSPALEYEKTNVLAVKVDNTIGGGDRWYSGAGIYRQVHLSVSHKFFIPRDGVKVTTLRLARDTARIRVSVETINKTGAAAEAEIRGTIVAPAAADSISFSIPVRCAADACTTVETDVEISNPVRWDIDNPALYGLSLILGDAVYGDATNGDAIIHGDAYPLRFGLREARFDANEGFFLNGRNLKLKGVNLHHDGGALGAAVPEAVWRRRFKKLKACGANAIRCSHNPQAAEFYDLADEMGFLLIDELCDKWTPTNMYFKEFFDEWWERDLETMIRRDRNHPSVILWSIGNELGDQFKEHFYEQLQRMCEKTRSLDPGRPVSAALAPPWCGDYDDRAPLERKIAAMLRTAGIVDVLMLNYTESFYAELKRCGLDKPIIGSEVTTIYRSNDNQYFDMPLRSPWWDVAKNSFVAGSFLWAGIDYLGEASMGWPSRGWTGSMLDSAGFEKIRTWYISAHWKEEPVLKLAVFDEAEPYDMAGPYWSFPQMRRHWNYPQPCPVKHVAAITNCELVKLYLNDETVRIAAPDNDRDSLAHIWVPFRPGVLRAEGYRNGVKVIEDLLRTAKRPAAVSIIAPLKAAREEVVPVEIWLNDAYGEPWVLDNPTARVSVKGDAELIALDNGNLCSTEVYSASARSFWNGHILALIRIGAADGTVRICVETEGMNSVRKDIVVSDT
jgi:beta-galactosidase